MLTTTRQRLLQELNGTYYSAEAPQAVIKALDRAMREEIRITLDYGDPDTGLSWGEEFDIHGYVERSSGSLPAPLLVHNKRSKGGVIILDDNIISIRYANKKQGGYLYNRDNEARYA